MKSEDKRALSGLKILDFTSLTPGPFATLALADMGADVLKFVSSKRPDHTETMGPFLPGTNISSGTAYLGRNKKVLTLNLKDSRARGVIYELVKGYDIVIEQNRPGVMDRLGLGYEQLKEINPAVIYCSLTGYGQDGPLSNRPGHDINYLALSGISSYSGRRGIGPEPSGIFLGDIASGSNNSVIGILAAVIYRQRTGKGQLIDISMTDGLVAFNNKQSAAYLVDGTEPKREGLYYNGAGVYDYYETKDGEYISVGVIEPKFVKALFNGLGRPDLANWDSKAIVTASLKEEIRNIFRQKTRGEWEKIFRDVEACFEPVLSLGEALNSPQARARGLVVDVPGPKGISCKQVGFPIKFSESQPAYRHIGKPLF